jgi:putative (di)nucleoside polyphosphate hydrolase
MIKRDPDKYRRAAGIALFNDEDQVFLGRRKNASGPYIWQMPQGGIDSGEKAYDAAVRELWEETGIHAKHIELIGSINEWLYYDFPPGFKGSKRAYGWHGQRQKWYAFRFTGKSKHVNLSAHKPIEFIDWRWESLSRSVKLVVPFKRPVYERIHTEFSKLTGRT